MNIIEKIADKVLVVERLDLTKEENQRKLDYRRATCDMCEYRDKRQDRCKICDCFLKVKTKSLTNRNKLGKVEITKCPKGFW